MTWELVKKFFMNYIWGGIVLLLLSVILELIFIQPDRHFSINLLILIFNYVGIAIIVSAIFSYASGTSQFMDQIKSLLESIVIKRNFLNNIDPSSKKDVLKALLEPSIAETNNYPNIGNYYGNFIEKALEIRKKNVRSNYAVNAHVHFDKTSEKIAIDSRYSYRLYPSIDGYGDVTIGFEEPVSGPSQCSLLSISTPEGYRVKKENLEFQEDINEGKVCKVSKTSINQNLNLKDCNHLDVDLNVKEFGGDHWALLSFKALQPTDGFKFYLKCSEEIVVKEFSVFVVGATYDVQQSDDKKEITISCNQWINEGSGLSILIGIPHILDNQSDSKVKNILKVA